MSENFLDHGPHLHAHAAPTTQQMRTVGQRRRDAEEKLEQHLQEARHKDLHDESVTQAGIPTADGAGVVGFQNDAGLPDGESVRSEPGPVVPTGTLTSQARPGNPAGVGPLTGTLTSQARPGNPAGVAHHRHPNLAGLAREPSRREPTLDPRRRVAGRHCRPPAVGLS